MKSLYPVLNHTPESSYTIAVPLTGDTYVASLMDITGHEIWTKLTQAGQRIRLNFGELNIRRGFYFISLQDADQK